MIAKKAYKPAPAKFFFQRQERKNPMANHKSSKKRIIRNANRALINGARMSRIRTFVKKVETAIADGDAGVAREALRQAQPEMQRGVSRGILHKNTVSRKISRLAARVKALAA
jgi:small subunit ribosomal protein S20